MSLSLNLDNTLNKIYNCSGKTGITFKGLIELCAITCEIDPNSIKTVSFDVSQLYTKERKVFPLRLSHFLTDINNIENDLAWKPSIDLLTGLKDSYLNDYSKRKVQEHDFTLDDH